jgi:uncharacterized protein with PIN domain
MVTLKEKSRLDPHALLCPKCKTSMKVRKRIPLPGHKFVDLDYRCDQCGAEVLRAVPRVKVMVTFRTRW